MKHTIVTIIICIVSFIVFAETVIEGSVSGLWGIDESPYEVQGDISIDEGDTLFIEPGVEVIFQDHYTFNIYGQLLAVGTLQDTILFTVADTTGFSNFASSEGGWNGIRFYNSETTQDTSIIDYCRMQYSKAIGGGNLYKGGALYSESSSFILQNSRIDHNYAGLGGGIYLHMTEAIIRNNKIDHNQAGNLGGGIYCKNTDDKAKIESNIIAHNIAASEGGGVYISKPFISNSLIYSNTAEFGGGIFLEGDGEIIGCTITNNLATAKGGGIHLRSCNTADILSCILWDNSASIAGNEAAFYAYWSYNPWSWNYFYVAANAEFQYCNIQGGQDNFYFNYEDATEDYGIGFNIYYNYNMGVDPHYVDPSNHNYRLSSESLCIDSGITEAYQHNLPEFDLDGNLRLIGDCIDIGCYEWYDNSDYEPEEVIFLKPTLKNYPNPFNPSTTISFNLPEDVEEASIEIFNIKGQKIKQYSELENQNSVVWNGTDNNDNPVSSGVYFGVLKAENKILSKRKLMLLK